VDEGRPKAADWQAAYRDLDNSALLALVPILDIAIEKGRRDLEMAQRALNHNEQDAAFAKDQLQRATTLQGQGVDVSEHLAATQELADSVTASEPMRQEHYRAMFAYTGDLITRREWILQEEACRRGLLPDPAAYLPPERRPSR
jgi:DNA repair protein RadC